MRIKKCLCLLIPELSNKYFLFIIFLICSLLRKSIPGILSDYLFEFKLNKKTDYLDKAFKLAKLEKFFDVVCNISSDLFTGIIHYILIKKDKKIYNNNNNNKISNKKLIKKQSKIEFIYNDKTINKKLFFKIIFLISFIDFTCQLCFYFSCHANKDYIENPDKKLHNIDYLYSFLVIDIVARYIFSRLLLNIHFYFHHYFSFAINIIILLILLIIDVNYKLGDYNKYFLVISFIQYVLYSLEDILNKIALTKLFIYPESLLFYKGICSLIFFFLYTFLILIIGDLDLSVMEFNINLFYGIITRIFFIVANIFRSVYLVKIIDFFSAQHISFLKVFESLILFLYYSLDRFIKKKEKDKYSEIDNYFDLDINIDLIEINACLILLISSLIHNEIIIINCNKLKKNTKFFLSIEADIENYKNFNKNSEIIDPN